MIPKSEREKDQAICEAASTDWREGAVEKWHLYCRATHPERLGDERVLMRANEHFPYEADVRAAAHCRNRLPLYIADAAEMERRVEAVAYRLEWEEGMAKGYAEEKEVTLSTHAAARADLLREILLLLRGEK